MVSLISDIARSRRDCVVDIVDDSPAALLYLSQILSDRYVVRAMGDGAEALNKIVRDPPDIVLLDVNMPKMGGYEVARRLKLHSVTEHLPIIFISGQGCEVDKVRAFTNGGVDYITKPFHTEETVARIETHLALNQMRRKLENANLLLRNLNGSLENHVRERTAELQQLNVALERFVPRESLGFLSKKSVAHIRRGDHIQKEMTVMFADIRAFTGLSERMTPQENFDFINAYLNYVAPPISEHGGFIDKYIGDGIMAVFPNHPKNAVQAAFAMQDQVRQFNKMHVSGGETAIRVGIGMHSGPVMFGTVGHPERLDVTVISDAVNLAFRMQELTKDFNSPIIASEATVEMLVGSTNPVRNQFLGVVAVKGKAERVSVYSIQPSDHADAIHWAREAAPDSAV